MSHIYVATKWENREYARRIMNALEERGHVITYDWTQQEQESTEQAASDVWGVQLADVLLILANTDAAYKGTYVELGVALGLFKRVLLVGDGLDACLFAKHWLVTKMSLEQVFLTLRV